MKHPYYLIAAAMIACATSAQAQDDNVNDGHYNPTVSGSIQSDMLVPTGKQDDKSNEDFRTNTFVDLNVMSKYIGGCTLRVSGTSVAWIRERLQGLGRALRLLKGQTEELRVYRR